MHYKSCYVSHRSILVAVILHACIYFQIRILLYYTVLIRYIIRSEYLVTDSLVPLNSRCHLSS